MPVPVQFPVVFSRLLTVTAWRDHRRHPVRFGLSHDGIAVIAFVRDEFGGGWHGFDAALGNLAIMHMSGRQEEDERPAFRVADGVEFGVASAFRAADTMSQGPPFPPPAQR